MGQNAGSVCPGPLRPPAMRPLPPLTSTDVVWDYWDRFGLHSLHCRMQCMDAVTAVSFLDMFGGRSGL